MGAAHQRYLKLGLIGHPVSHSISPLLHGAALSYAKISGEYNLIDVEPEALVQRVRDLVASGYAGWNVTVPHKQSVLQLMDELTDEAKKVGAVNTVSTTDGTRLIGHNTDLGGFVQALQLFLSDRGTTRGAVRTAVVLGAGGASRAAIWGLAECGAKEITIVARNASQAANLAAELRADKLNTVQIETINSAAANQLRADVVVHCTPVGLSDPNIPEWMQAIFATDKPALLYDMVYSGKTDGATPLVSLARSNGWYAQDGLQMLIHQALLAFEFWTGARVPLDVMIGAIRT